MRWTDLLAEVKVLEAAAAAEVEVAGVQYDSRRVGAGDVFVAMRGGVADGNRFVEAALGAGAMAVVTDARVTYEALCEREVPVALVEHGRRALAQASAAVFGHPERALKVSAITGTNGKTTTAFLLAQMLESAGRKVLLLGTVETRIAGRVLESTHTTPEARDLYALFAEAVAAGCTEVVMEMSSHALEQERVWGVPVDVAVFTNLTQDHLDYHGTMDAYAAAKAKLFAGVGAGAPRVAVVNADDAYADVMLAAAEGSVRVAYGLRDAAALEVEASYVARVERMTAAGTRFVVRGPEGETLVRSPLAGVVNVYNLLAARCAAEARGVLEESIERAIAGMKAAPGRFEVVPGSERAGFVVVVDYAHTDDALANLLRLARELVAPVGGRVVTLFGCGGDRDRTKRPKMGRVAAEASDVVVVTSDNPRSEEPRGIIEQVLVGVRAAGSSAEVMVEPDRRVAIAKAIAAARVGDIVLLAGKGHEKTQTFADRTVAFDDVAEAAAVLKEIK